MDVISATPSLSLQLRAPHKTHKLKCLQTAQLKKHRHFFINSKETSICHLQFQCFFLFRFRVASPRSSPGELAYAHQPFDEIPVWDTFAWNNLLQTHLSNGDAYQILFTYGQMLVRGVRPDRHTFPRVITASRLSGALFFGKQVHGHALKLGLSSDHYVVTALMELYGRLECADSAKWLFEKSLHNCTRMKSAISWTLLGRLYVEEGKPRQAIDLFTQMVSSGAVDVDSVSLATVIGACSLLKSLKEGRNAHRIAKERGLESHVLVSNSLLKMYIDCGSLRDARLVFDRIPSRDAISWTEMLRGYVRKGGFNEALKLFRHMNYAGIRPDPLAISSVLPACARVAANKNGKEIHGYLVKNGIDMNRTVENALMDMYVKSGSLEYASRIFIATKNKDVVSWTVMILGNTFHGHGELAVGMSRQMEKNLGTEMDELMYMALLYACCAARLVEDGWFYFNRIRAPKIAHCTLMVAILARAGLFDEAWSFIKKRGIERHAEVLRSLLNGCRIHQNRNMGRRVIEQLCDLEPLNAENYVLLANWYAHNGKWDMVNKLRETINDMDLKPRKAYSWIEFRNKVHVFSTGDASHPRSKKIYSDLEILMKKTNEEGFSPSLDFSLHDVDEERECIPLGHSEMLAVSFGLISTQAGATIRVTKNLRVCRSCHEFLMLISRIVGREIIIKDQSCFHHFKDGSCSCQEF
ncbi:hypothetical protein NMG60_11035219 [Bertholletia excelsa]